MDSFACTDYDRQTMNVLPMTAYFPDRSLCLVRRLDAFVPPHVGAFIKLLVERAAELGAGSPSAETASA